MGKFDFYMDNVKKSFTERQLKMLPEDFFDASYIRVFREENIILIEKVIYKNKIHKVAVFAYSFTDCNFKFEVEIPDEYTPLYFISLRGNVGMVCKHKNEKEPKAIECEIDKCNGKIIKTRSLPCSGNIMFNNRDNNEISENSAVKNLSVDKTKNIASWNFNDREITVECNQKILYLSYSDFQETILMLSENEDGKKRADLYNLNGTYRLNLKVPAEFEILEIPCSFLISDIGRTLTLWLYNEKLHFYELRYIIVPDNGDLIFTGAIRL